MKKILITALLLLSFASCDKTTSQPDRIKLSENATYEEIYNAVATPLKNGETKLDLTLPSQPSDMMFKAIRRALIETEEVTDGSIEMTLWGAQVIGENAFGYHADLNNESVDELKSVTLPDAVEIMHNAFYGCGELLRFSAPKAKTLGRNVFVICNKLIHIDLPVAETIGHGSLHNINSLTSICLPELKVLSSGMLALCENLETVVLPKVTRIEERAFEENRSLKTIVFGSPIEMVDREVFWFHDRPDMAHTERIDLVLSIQQRKLVNHSYDSQEPYQGVWYADVDRFDFQDKEFAGYRFQSIRPYEDGADY